MNRGAIALQRVMKKRKMSQADVRRAIDVSPGVVTRWLRGIRKPGIRIALTIESVFGIPVRSWTEDAPEERKTGTDS
jgi:transcriptional regulator with XRE-family HTH domain